MSTPGTPSTRAGWPCAFGMAPTLARPATVRAPRKIARARVQFDLRREHGQEPRRRRLSLTPQGRRRSRRGPPRGCPPPARRAGCGPLARLASIFVAAVLRPRIAAIASNGISNTSCSTNDHPFRRCQRVHHTYRAEADRIRQHRLCLRVEVARPVHSSGPSGCSGPHPTRAQDVQADPAGHGRQPAPQLVDPSPRRAPISATPPAPRRPHPRATPAPGAPIACR